MLHFVSLAFLKADLNHTRREQDGTHEIGCIGSRRPSERSVSIAFGPFEIAGFRLPLTSGAAGPQTLVDSREIPSRLAESASSVTVSSESRLV